MKTIESAANPAVRRLVELRKRRRRSEQNRFLIEGVPEVRRAIESGIVIESLFVTGDPDPDLAGATGMVVRLQGSAADRAFVRERGGGVIAIAEPPLFLLGSLPETDFVALAESIEKPGNLGAMLRSANAAGVGAIVVCDPTVDPLNPNVIRSSLGSVFSIPVAVSPLTDAVTWLRDRTLPVVALDPAGSVLYDTDMSGPVALAVGSEHDGISPELRSAADQLISIPMVGSVDSLNAATALAVGLFEVVRQRASHEPEA